MTKRSAEKSKSATTTAHPEMQHSRTKSGAPGTESSKAEHTARDARSKQDPDGNSEQRPR